MNIESLEINLLKASEIKDGDIILVKIDNKTKSELNKETITNLYQKITDILKKQVPIYFFPSDVSIEILKKTIEIQENLNQTSE